MILTAKEQGPEAGSCEQGNNKGKKRLDWIQGEKFSGQLCYYNFQE
jgi:hypothetical protein